MKRVFALLSVLLIASVLLAACAPAATPAPEPTKALEPTKATEPTKAPEPTAMPMPAWEAPKGALVSSPADAAPKLDGMGDDAAWTTAQETVVKVAGGFGGFGTDVKIKSVYTADEVYFLVSYADPSKSFFRSPWQKQADGSWKKVVDPNDKGGDNNTVYEDKVAFIWPIGAVKNFETAGCFTACHAGENSDIKPYGNKYLSDGEKADIWHWKSVRNLNQVDDQYLDSVKLDTSSPEAQAKTIEAGRHSDPKEKGGYADNFASMPDPKDASKTVADKSKPGFTSPNIDMATGAPGYILDSEKVALDQAALDAMPVGSYLPGIIKSEIVGDRGDIKAGWNWKEGVWTLEFGRKLVTKSETDVEFSDLKAVYYFAMAVFENAQVRHAFQTGATPFVFMPKP